jgi:hypothetical protein
MRVLNILLGMAVLGLALWFAHKWDTKDHPVSAHEAVVDSFQKALPIGTSRADVEQYLESHGMKYSSAWESGRNSWSDVVEAGKGSGVSAKCGTQSLLVSLEFDSSSPNASEKPRPGDRLKRVVIANASSC